MPVCSASSAKESPIACRNCLTFKPKIILSYCVRALIGGQNTIITAKIRFARKRKRGIARRATYFEHFFFDARPGFAAFFRFKTEFASNL